MWLPIAVIITISFWIVCGLFWLIYGVELASDSDTMKYPFLPALNASLNTISASAIIAGIYFISKGRKKAHGISMICALSASALFLVGYIVHHSLHGDTKFTATGWVRPTYFFILISHIILSVVALPMVLTTVFYALIRKWDKHRAIARWTWPIWLYVSVTGVLVFFFLRVFNL